MRAGQIEENRGVVAALDKRSVAVLDAGDNGGNSQGQEKKRRLTPEQLEFLEKSFQEDAKLEPERKLLLARQLCLQPRQVAVWFQNRRARWKTKQLERLYTSLKHDYDAVSREKQRLQDEVVRLKAQLMGSAPIRGSVGEKGDEMLESMVIVRCNNSVFNKSQSSDHLQQMDCNYLLSTDEYGHCGSLPGYM